MKTEKSAAKILLACETGTEKLIMSPAGDTGDAFKPLAERNAFTAAVVSDEGATKASTYNLRHEPRGIGNAIGHASYLFLAQVLSVEVARRRRNIEQGLLESRPVVGHERHAQVEHFIGRCSAVAHEALGDALATLVDHEVVRGGVCACQRCDRDERKEEGGSNHWAWEVRWEPLGKKTQISIYMSALLVSLMGLGLSIHEK